MIEDVGTTEGQVDHENNLHSGMHYPPCPSHHHQELAEPLSHGGHLVQRLADGHVAVIRHDDEEYDLRSSQEVFRKELSQAATQGDGSPLVQYVSDPFRGGDGCVGDICEGRVSEKEVYGSRKCGTEGDGNDNEQVGQNSE